MTDPLVSFARNVRARRKALKLTQEAAGDRAQMDMSYWGRLERGDIDPGLRTMARIATALDTTPADLLADASDTLADQRDVSTTRDPTAPAYRRDLATSSSLALPLLPTSLVAYPTAVVYFPTNYSSPLVPARLMSFSFPISLTHLHPSPHHYTRSALRPSNHLAPAAPALLVST